MKTELTCAENEEWAMREEEKALFEWFEAEYDAMRYEWERERSMIVRDMMDDLVEWMEWR